MTINLIEVTKCFLQKNSTIKAIENISLSINNGEFISIIGPSGCGKTTLLKIIGGLLKPTSGEVYIGDKTPDISLNENKIGFVFQNPTLLKWRTAKENVSLPIEIINELRVNELINYKDKIPELAKNMLDLVGLKGFYNSYPNELSGGMQQRVALARTLIFNPEILLMDEPFGALDGFTRQKMQMLVLNLWDQTQKTIIFVTHDLSEAIFVSDRIIVISERPARMVADIQIKLDRPREKGIRLTRKFLQYEEILWQYLGEK